LKLLFSFLLVTTGIFAKQKVVLISGATSGIGLATTKAFQEKGWTARKEIEACRINLMHITIIRIGNQQRFGFSPIFGINSSRS
jgi:hypothetical protein